MSRLLSETRATLGLPAVKAFPSGGQCSGNTVEYLYQNVSASQGANLEAVAKTYWRDSKAGELSHPHQVKNGHGGVFLTSDGYWVSVGFDPLSKTLNLGGATTCR